MEMTPSRQLAALMNNASVAFFIMDERQHCIYMNPAAEAMTGYGLDQVRGRPLHNFVHHTRPDGSPYPIEECPIDQAFPENDRQQGEEVFVHKSGRFYDVGYTASPIRENGVPVGTAIEVRDITERKRADRVLRQSEERFRLFVQQAPVSIAMFDREMRYSAASDNWLRDYGLPRDVIGQSHYEIFPNGVPERWREAHSRGLAGETVRHAQDRFEAPDGSVHWLRWEVRPWYSADESLGGITIFAEDITEQCMSEERLRASESFHRQTLESIPGMTFTNLPDGLCDYVSRQWEEFTGIPASEQLGDRWVHVLHPEDRESAASAWRQAVTTQRDYDAQYRVRRHDGNYEWFKVRGRPIRALDGSIVRWLGTAVNIDDLIRAEAALKETDRRKDEFLAVLAHELRNPLAPIRSGLFLLRRTLEDPRARTDTLDMMDRQLNHLVRLIDDLMDVSRINRGRIELRLVEVNLSGVVLDAVEAARSALRERRLDVIALGEPHWVRADPARLTQVITNLLQNAAKFTSAGGHVVLRAERVGAEIVLSVEDDGVGIPVDKLDKVFDMFTQLDEEGQRRGGMGIGLALVKQLVAMHGGTVDAKSEGRGHGAKFTVRLPALDKTPDTAIPTPPARAGSALRILIVDDNRDAAQSLATVLGTDGHITELAFDGMEALEKARDFGPQVVLLDLGMPRMDGYETCRAIRREDWGRKVTVIALTGWGQEADRKRSADAGFDRHLVKPVDPAKLAEVLAALRT